MRFLTATILGVAAVLASAAFADERNDKALQLSQGVIGSSVPDYSFRDTEGRSVAFARFRGKPLLVSLIYTSCADVCPAVIENLAPAVAVAEETLGKDSFNVVTIGFDPRADTPERMRAFARAHNAGGPNWHFLSTDASSLERFTAAVGFSYFATAGGFDHLAQVTVLDGNGKIYSQVYGSTFDVPAIVDPLRDIILGRDRSIFSLQGLSDRVKLFCSVYDPATGRYYFDYALLASIVIGAISLAGVLAFLIRETRKSFRAGGA